MEEAIAGRASNGLTKFPLYALVVDDEPEVRRVISRVLEDRGWIVSEAESAARAKELLDAQSWMLIFLDKCLPDGDGLSILQTVTKQHSETSVVMITGQGSYNEAILAMTSGALNYLAKPFTIPEVREQIERCLARLEQQELGQTSVLAPNEAGLVARSARMIAIGVQLQRVAKTDIPVFISGETGTGKEVVARELHRLSARASSPFVTVNCGAIAPQLIESELFGHVRGAFTGADRDRKGLLEEANQGTIFLDEITETLPMFQVKLLRALQQGEIRKVGCNNVTKINVRVVTATNRNINEEVEAGRFRMDLFYRLNSCILEIPALKERPEDILPLVEYFAACAGRSVGFSELAITALRNYSWPGNVRELENAVTTAAKTCDGIVQLRDLPKRMWHATSTSNDAEADALIGRSEEFLPLREATRNYIEKVMAHTGGNKSAAARILGVSYRSMFRMLKTGDDDTQIQVEQGEATCSELPFEAYREANG
ncbi:MAG TPA: sigma-54 dependent transcriptional regulator [Pyrinomonadaceae bacterium]